MSSGSVERVSDGSLIPLGHLTTGIECEPTEGPGLSREDKKDLRQRLNEIEEARRAADPFF